ncbi:hypothetical protein K438DRAFT_1634372 [Mycena galopus ATCC 62051]|nr:hypothetical protein K438DRAFT_1634372 [Mycena galopus ATCC 62051]
MRQTVDSVDDTRFRTALENMRFASCTLEDIKYLGSRVVSDQPDRPTFKDKSFHNVSVITALNSHKDKINELGCQRFAAETSQMLTDFYSEDCLASNDDNQRRRPKTVKGKKVLSSHVKISDRRQRELWDAHPSFTSEHVAGKLRLCIGMPVMLRHNDATELCITKGQEATVVGWKEAVGSREQRILDCLFVKLIQPPKTIQVPGLPENVVALTKASKKIWCSLPDDRSIHIAREQVLVLPNFAMTDYASQGKTRVINVVDLNNCRTHFSYYTALSRGTTSAGTVILQGFDSRKITRGISGFLRQELRELEILNELTKLRYEGIMVPVTTALTRRDALRMFYEYKKAPFDSDILHPALRYKVGDDVKYVKPIQVGEWKLLDADQKKFAKEFEPSAQVGKRKTSSPVASDQHRAKKIKLLNNEPQGLVWDSENYSCAYDALFTCLYHMWRDQPALWTNRLSGLSPFCASLAKGFESVLHHTDVLEGARDSARELLHRHNRLLFPLGPVLINLSDLVVNMFGGICWGSTTIKCATCDVTLSENPGFECIIDMNPNSKSAKQGTSSISSWEKSRRITECGQRCPICDRRTLAILATDVSPPLLYIGLNDPHVNIDTALAVTVANCQVRYALRGITYYADHHFTSRIITQEVQCWFHDGIETGPDCVAEGNIHQKPAQFLGWLMRGHVKYTAIGALYALVD